MKRRDYANTSRVGNGTCKTVFSGGLAPLLSDERRLKWLQSPESLCNNLVFDFSNFFTSRHHVYPPIQALLNANGGTLPFLVRNTIKQTPEWLVFSNNFERFHWSTGVLLNTPGFFQYNNPT